MDIPKNILTFYAILGKINYSTFVNSTTNATYVLSRSREGRISGWKDEYSDAPTDKCRTGTKMNIFTH